VVPVRRDVAEALRLARRDRRARRPPADGHAPARRDQPRDRLGELVLPVALDARDADDLAGAHGQAHAVKPRPDRQALHREHHALARRRRRGLRSRGLAAHDRARHLRHRRARAERRHGPPAPQHGHRVGDRADLLELVGHEHDGRPAVAQPAQGREQPLDLDRRQHRGRLVEDQDLRAAGELADDLRALAHRDRQRLDDRVRIHREPDVPAQGREPPRRRRQRQHRPALAPEHRVLDDGEARHQRAVLLHHADAARPRHRRRVPREVDRRAVDRQGAALGAHQPEHHAQEGRLPGPVLADDRVDRPAPHRQRRARERHRRAEPLVGGNLDRQLARATQTAPGSDPRRCRRRRAARAPRSPAAGGAGSARR
jgi:hypothetical protein